MLDLDDLAELGIKPSLNPEIARPTVRNMDGLPELERDSAPARALYQVWRGRETVIVDAPPGSGKTSSVVDIVHHLVVRLGMNITIGCYTRQQAVMLATRLIDQLPPHTAALDITDAAAEGTPQRVLDAVIVGANGSATVRTLRSCVMRPPSCDLMVVDEAYQATFADVASAAAFAPQLLLVGDPGQIGPVVNVNTTVWDQMKLSPQSRAPEAFVQRKEAITLTIDRTYRLGPITTAAISELYKFKFDSRRPERHLLDSTGNQIPEISTIHGGNPTAVDDVTFMSKVADRAEELVGTPLFDNGTFRRLEQADVAVVVSRTSQVAMLTGLLAARELKGIKIGTADKLQGGEWAAVVAVDSLAGNETTDHLTTLGRLCVMASRHSAHLTWVWADGWREQLLVLAESDQDALTGIRVREALIAQPAVSLRSPLLAA